MLGLIAEGLSDEAIAERLEATRDDVEADVDQIFVKLDLRDERADRRVAAVLTYLRRDVRPLRARRSHSPDVRRAASVDHVRACPQRKHGGDSSRARRRTPEPAPSARRTAAAPA